MKYEPEQLTIPFEPFIEKDSEILILGTFPSPKSREEGFYYGHPQNRFWKIVAKLLNQEVPVTVEQKKAFLKRNHIALWDTLESCTITGASDASIKNPKVNDVKNCIKGTKIKQIFTTGKKAESLYNRYIKEDTGMDAIGLPSSSPRNCTMDFDTLCEKYKVLLDYLGDSSE